MQASRMFARVAVSQQVRSRVSGAVRGGGHHEHPIPWGGHGPVQQPGETMPWRAVGASRSSVAAGVVGFVTVSLAVPAYGMYHSMRKK